MSIEKIFSKSDDKEPRLPLLNHLLDVNIAFGFIWENLLSLSIKNNIAQDLNRDFQTAGKYLAYFAGLHDIGKATEYFQENVLKKSNNKDAAKNHAILSSKIIYNYEFKGLTNLGKQLSLFLAMHHGAEISYEDRGSDKAINIDKIIHDKVLFLDEIINKYNELLNINYDEITLSLDENKLPVWGLVFVGVTTFADWLVSQESHWKDENNDIYTDYETAETRVKKTIEQSNIYPNIEISIDENDLFNTFFKSIVIGGNFEPRPLQSKVINEFSSTSQSLTFIEAPTGEGKTEAAFALAGSQLMNKTSGGIFIAMPTQATSNMLYQRFNEFLHNAAPDIKNKSSVLVHANAKQNELYKKLLGIDANINPDEKDFLVSDWFTNKKLSLISQFGVGTVDQALLSVLNVKHFFLRLFGLAGKTIIFDEVHAYDICMELIMGRLLSWLKAFGSSVIILSATLPEKMKREYIKAWSGEEPEKLSSQYPLITQVISSDIKEETFEVSEANNNKEIEMEFLYIAEDLESISEQVLSCSKPGARIAVLLNTVCRTQKLFKLINEKTEQENDKYCITLFHSRFMLKDRNKIEEDVKKRYGKGSGEDKEKIKIVIATQVIEQSLDLDFDVMFTDFAPIDLLLQRAGRVHRHNRSWRPAGLEKPSLKILITPEDEHGMPNFKENASIYEEYYLLLSYNKLKNIQKWSFAGGSIYRSFVESVYGEDYIIKNDEMKKRVKKRDKEVIKENKAYTKEMNRQMIVDTNEFSYFFEDYQKQMGTEDENNRKKIIAKTRCGDSVSKQYIILFAKEEKLYFDENYTMEVDLDRVKIDYEKYIQNQISIYYINLLEEEKQEIPKELHNTFPENDFIIYNKDTQQLIFEYSSKIGLSIKQK